MIFVPPYSLSRVRGYSQLLLCEAPKLGTRPKSIGPSPNINFTDTIWQIMKNSFQTSASLEFERHVTADFIHAWNSNLLQPVITCL